MLTRKPTQRKNIFWLIMLILILSACSNSTPTTDIATLTPETATPTLAQPTLTPVPAIAVINGERIPLTWFESEVDRYLLMRESMGEPVEDETTARETVLSDLIDQVLLAQSAHEAGFTVSDADILTRIDAMAKEYDLAAWMEEWGYSEEDLLIALELQILAAFQRDSIVESVPKTTEQVKLQQVFTYIEADAKNALLSLNSGTPFDEVAFSYYYDPITGGNLGWIPRGYLLNPAVEEAAFSLPVGTYSEVIESDVGYHIILVIEREERPLTNDALLTLQRQALYDWLSEQREKSSIEVLTD